MLAEDFERELERWERRARGYDVYDHHVELEPAYSALLGQARARVEKAIDDGKRPGFWDSIRGRMPEAAPKLPPAAEPRPQPFRAEADLCELQLVLPEAFAVKSGFAAEFLTALHNLSHPIAFELIGLPQGIVVQLSCSPRDRSPILENLRAFFPEVKVREHRGVLRSEWESRTRWATLIDFGLSEYFFRCCKAGPRLETDPLIGVVGALNELEDDELAVVQVLFQPAIRPWGGDLFDVAQSVEGAEVIQPLLNAKFREPLLATLVRVATLAPPGDLAFERARSIGNALIAATSSDMNMIIPLDNEGYDHAVHAEDILRRETHRSGMLLNLSELLTLVHLPSASVRSERMGRQDEKTKPAPEIALDKPLLIGLNEHDGEEQRVGITVEQRLRHTYVIGASGTGKSTLLLSMIQQDLRRGDGFAVLDPHGDLIDDVIARIPDERLADVVLFNPADEEYPVAFNILSARSELERILLSSDLVGVFRRLSTSWGDQMTSVLGNAVLAFLESTEGGTLLDLRRFLVDVEFRKRFVRTVTDPEVVYFWEHEFPLLKGLPQGPLLTRLDTFVRPKLIRYMVAQKKDRLDLRSIMDERKILLAKLSQGAIGEENSYLLGSLLVAKINQVAMSRQEQEKGRRVPFYLYIDEFHNFVTPSIAAILAGARKYAVGLTLAHQDMRQLKSRSEDVASAVLGNAYTRVVFRVGDVDAKSLAEGFSYFEPRDLQNLGVGEAIARVERAEYDFNLKTTQLDPVEPDEAEFRREQVVAISRSAYATPREEVEALLRADYPISPPPEPSGSPTTPPRPSTEPPKDPKGPRFSPPAPESKGEPPKVTHEPGRGGPQHKYLQSLLKRTAEDRGFRATLEKTVLGGHGHIDVALEREGLSVACEISVTTTTEHELDNLSKCLAAGFDYALLISSEKRVLQSAEREFLPQLSDDQKEKVRFLTPESFISFLDQTIADMRETTQTVRGYKVNVKYRAVSEEERRQKERILADVISKSLRQSKSKKK